MSTEQPLVITTGRFTIIMTLALWASRSIASVIGESIFSIVKFTPEVKYLTVRLVWCWLTLTIPVVVVPDRRYFVLSLADSVWWPIFSRAVMMSLHKAVGVESSQYWSRSILHRTIPPSGDNAMISCSLLTGTSKATPSEYQSFIPTSSSVSWWMVGVVIPVHN